MDVTGPESVKQMWTAAAAARGVIPVKQKEDPHGYV